MDGLLVAQTVADDDIFGAKSPGVARAAAHAFDNGAMQIEQIAGFQVAPIGGAVGAIRLDVLEGAQIIEKLGLARRLWVGRFVARQAQPAAARVTSDVKALNARLAGELGLAADTVVLLADGPFGDFYVSEALAPALRTRALARAKALFAADGQVEAVFTRAELAALPIPSGSEREWSLAERARASFHPDRSGDLIVLLKPLVTPIAAPGRGYVATHGSPWDYDRRVPLLFWQKGRTGFEATAAGGDGGHPAHSGGIGGVADWGAGDRRTVPGPRARRGGARVGRGLDHLFVRTVGSTLHPFVLSLSKDAPEPVRQARDLSRLSAEVRGWALLCRAHGSA